MPKKNAPKKPPPPNTAMEAYLEVEPELLALKPEEIAAINLDIPQAVAIALGALPKIKEMRPAIVKSLPDHPMAQFDKQDRYAMAAWYAHLMHLAESGPKAELQVLLEEGEPLRANLLRDAEALAGRNLLDADVVKDIRAGHGNIDTANDLVALSALFMANWGQVEKRTAATAQEVQRAGELGPLILAALGVRQVGAQPAQSNAADRRARAFTLFTRTYDETRRAISYLRWHQGDADDIAPSLYAKTRKTRSKGNEGDEAPSAEDGAQTPKAT